LGTCDVEIRPATITQIEAHRTAGGLFEYVEISDDVQGVANLLHEIDEHLRLRYSKAGQYFVVYWRHDGAEDGDGHLILTAQELDHRIVKRIEQIASADYDYSFELERLDAEEKKRRREAINEKLGETAERAYFELRKIHGKLNDRAYVTGLRDG
jgi:hypothetical protein